MEFPNLALILLTCRFLLDSLHASSWGCYRCQPASADEQQAHRLTVVCKVLSKPAPLNVVATRPGNASYNFRRKSVCKPRKAIISIHELKERKRGRHTKGPMGTGVHSYLEIEPRFGGECFTRELCRSLSMSVARLKWVCLLPNGEGDAHDRPRTRKHAIITQEYRCLTWAWYCHEPDRIVQTNLSRNS